MRKVAIVAALTGTSTSKEANPNTPVTPQEIARDAVAVAKAGASMVHIHVRDEKGKASMQTKHFVSTFEAVKEAVEKEGIDLIINLTTSGSEIKVDNETRVAQVKALRPEICSFDAGTMNWGNWGVFYNEPDFLDVLSETAVKEGVKPEFEIFNSSMIENAKHYIEKYNIPGPHIFQFVMGVVGGAPADVKNLLFETEQLPEGALWSVTGVGKAHLPMLYAGIAMGANYVRVGLEDNLYYSHGVKATNEQLVERAARLIREFGCEVMTVEETRQMLGFTRHSLKEYNKISF